MVIVPEVSREGTFTRTYDVLIRVGDDWQGPYQDMWVVGVDTLGLGGICKVPWSVEVAIVVICME
jgi:hypothetical protein